MTAKQILAEARRRSQIEPEVIVAWIDEAGSDRIAGYAEYLERARPGDRFIGAFVDGEEE